jgi:hypothetical protein
MMPPLDHPQTGSGSELEIVYNVLLIVLTLIFLTPVVVTLVSFVFRLGRICAERLADLLDKLICSKKGRP